MFSRSPGHETQLLARRLSEKLVQQLRELPLQMDDDDDSTHNREVSIPDAAATAAATPPPSTTTATSPRNVNPAGEFPGTSPPRSARSTPSSSRPVSRTTHHDAANAPVNDVVNASSSADANAKIRPDSAEGTHVENTNSDEGLPRQLQDALLLSDVETFEQLRATFLRSNNVRSSYTITTSIDTSTSSVAPPPLSTSPILSEQTETLQQHELDPVPTMPRDNSTSDSSPVQTPCLASGAMHDSVVAIDNPAAPNITHEIVPPEGPFSFVKHPNWEPVRRTLHERLEFVRTLREEKKQQWTTARASILQVGA